MDSRHTRHLGERRLIFFSFGVFHVEHSFIFLTYNKNKMTQYNLTNSNNTSEKVITKNFADGNANYDIPISENCSFRIDIIWINADVADGTFKLKAGPDGINFDDFAGANTVTNTVSATAAMDGWEKQVTETPYLRVAFTKGTNTTGTYLIILTTKAD